MPAFSGCFNPLLNVGSFQNRQDTDASAQLEAVCVNLNIACEHASVALL
jgi:hypothetical protein